MPGLIDIFQTETAVLTSLEAIHIMGVSPLTKVTQTGLLQMLNSQQNVKDVEGVHPTTPQNKKVGWHRHPMGTAFAVEAEDPR